MFHNCENPYLEEANVFCVPEHLGKSQGHAPMCEIRMFTGTAANERRMDGYTRYKLHTSAMTL